MKEPETCSKLLADVNGSPLNELLEARALVSEDMWRGYKMLQINGLQEQIIFYAARKKMMQWWKDRYPRPEKTNGTGGTGCDGVRCGESGIGQPNGTVGTKISDHS